MTVEKRVLQIVVALACLVPFSVAIPSVLHGAAVLKGVPRPVPADLDSHFRYLSGIFLMLGIGFASCIPGIERKGGRFRLLGAMVICGGLARALSWAEVGAPSVGHRLGLGMELGVVPLLMLWQWRLSTEAVWKRRNVVVFSTSSGGVGWVVSSKGLTAGSRFSCRRASTIT